MFTPLGYGACEPHCNPVTPYVTDATHVACTTGQRCSLAYDGAQGDTYCEAPAGTLGQGASCGIGTDCKEGYDCLGPMGGPYSCKQYCRVGFADCASSCIPFAPPQYDKTVQIGGCQ